VNLLPCAITLKSSKIAIDSFPRRKVTRQLSPRTTGAHDIHDGIDHLAHIVSTRAAAPLGCRNQRIDQSPLIVGQIGAGRSVDQILIDYPYLEHEDVMQALRYAAWRAEEREVALPSA